MDIHETPALCGIGDGVLVAAIAADPFPGFVAEDFAATYEHAQGEEPWAFRFAELPKGGESTEFVWLRES